MRSVNCPTPTTTGVRGSTCITNLRLVLLRQANRKLERVPILRSIRTVHPTNHREQTRGPLDSAMETGADCASAREQTNSRCAYRLCEDLPRQRGGLGRRLADLDAGGLEGLLLGLRRCPHEPDTMAPAWPIVLPSGAVKPAT